MKTHAANGFDAIVVGSGLGWLTALALALAAAAVFWSSTAMMPLAAPQRSIYGCLPIEARCVS
jgi:hypothetical protein